MADTPRDLLQQLCDDEAITRFSPAEMVELLEDGEEVGWIVEQVFDGADTETASRLREFLTAIQAEVAPTPAADEEAQAAAHLAEGDSAEDDAAESDAGEGAAADLMEALSGGGVDLAGLDLPPGVDANQLQQVMSSPRGALLADFGAYCEEQGLSQDAGADPEAEEAMRRLHDEWLETPRPALEGKRPSELLEGGRLFPDKVETYRREAPKVGRNDPCPCGSGKKYKKCCGKAA